ncbi:hypothetical protein NIES22_25860 [Calothrix brevissima NIES-22]|nr:hypothetical protein NIES22_25860 [Calothrix brevissima NIES-22]
MDAIQPRAGFPRPYRLCDLNKNTVFGIVSNGAVWPFGKLNLDIFTQNKTFYTIQDMERLFAAFNYVFQQCELQLDRPAT